MAVYKDTIKAAKASTVKVRFEDKEKASDKLQIATTILSGEKDTTITTHSTDTEISGIIQNPLSKLKKVTE